MKIVAGMATFTGREEQCKIAVKSLEDAGVEVNVYHNDKEEVDYTDNAKFYFLQQYKEPVIYLSVDDDLYYTKEYVHQMVQAVERYKCIVSIHGRTLLGKGRNYYRGHTPYSCLKSVDTTLYIDVCGTGVTAFNTAYFNPTELYKSEYKKMSDIVFSLEAAKSDKKLLHLKHKRGVVRYLHPPKRLTIHETEHRNCEVQSQLADEIYDIKRNS